MSSHRLLSRAVTARALSFASVAILSFLVALTGCGVQTTSAPPTADQIYQRAASSAMKDAQLTLSGSISATSTGQTITLDMTGTGQIVVKPSAAYHMALTLSLNSAQIHGTIVGDLIQVGGKLYARTQVNISGLPSTGTSKYTETPAPASQSSLIPSNLGNLKIVGEDTIRGDKCWHLSGVESANAAGTPAASGTSGTHSVKVDEWIRESDYYYVRLKLNTLPGLNLPIGGPSSGSSTTASANFTVDLSNYDQGVTISPPPASQIGTSSGY
jgi:hypothetical protein